MTTPYSEALLVHLRSPQNQGAMSSPSHYAKGSNPLCGDHCEIYLRLENKMVLDVSFVAVGCAVVKSTASLMTTLVKGTGIHEIQQMTKDFQEFLADTSGAPVVANWLEPFKALQGYPVRARCALLPWVTLNRALSETELSD